MFSNMVLGQYIPAGSLIHQLDPRTKIIAVALLMTGVFFLSTALGFFLWLLWVAFLVKLTMISPLYLFKGVKPIWIIIILTVIIHFFMTPGEVIKAIGPFTITAEGLERGLLIGARIFFLVIITSLLTLTTSPLELTDGLESLLKPLKKVGVPAHELAMMMTIALRFIPILMLETERVMKAQMARGMDFSTGSFSRRLKNLVPLLVPLFVSAFRRADELALAMEARCYRGGEGRTRMKVLRFHRRDWTAFALVVAASILAVWGG